MEHAQAGSGLQDVPATHTIPNGHANITNGSMPEKQIVYSTTAQNGPSRRSRNSKTGGGVEDIALCASPAGFLTRKQKGQTAEKESIGGMLRKAMVDHQLGISLNLILLGTLTYLLFPSLRERVGAFSTLQYPTGNAGEFSVGPRDTYLVAGFVVLFTGMRAACMDYVLLPLTGVLGIKQKKTKVRYAEWNKLFLDSLHSSADYATGLPNKHTSCSTTLFTGAGGLPSSSKTPPSPQRPLSSVKPTMC
jgi:hypothetical protein